MDIHKPKPWHGLREFLKEYAIIVLGVLTALGLEQSAEWLHWRHVVHHDRVALRDESADIYGALLGRVDQQDCIDRRLADIGAILKRHSSGEPLRISGPVGRPSSFIPSLGAFDMAIADQSLSHMSQEEKSSYYAVRSSWTFFDSTESAELDTWRTLRALDHADALTPNRWEEVSKAYDRASDLNEVLKANLRYGQGSWLEPFRSLPRPSKEDTSLRIMPWVKQLCAGTIAP